MSYRKKNEENTETTLTNLDVFTSESPELPSYLYRVTVGGFISEKS